MKYDIATGKTQLIVFPTVEQFKIVFYRKKFEINDTTFRKLIPGLDQYLDRVKQVKCNANAKRKPSTTWDHLGCPMLSAAMSQVVLSMIHTLLAYFL